jgi:hypothetical protein
MSYQKYLARLSALGVAFFVELVTFSLMMPQLRAQPSLVSLTFPPTESRGAPARTSGGGTRSIVATCIKGSRPLTALTPSNNVVTTVSPNPTLFWYVPQTVAKFAELVVVDDRGNEVYQTILTLNGTPGVVKLSLPASVSLKTGKDYEWYFGLICNQEQRSQDTFVRGVIERTELNSAQKTKLAAAKRPLDRAEVYAGAKVWQETLMILAQLRQQRPNDSQITEAWKELLSSVQLEAIATEPLVECCKTETALE